MNGDRWGGRVPARLRRLPARLGLLGLVLTVVVLPLAPTGANAAGTVTPVVNCVLKLPAGSYVAVIGYTNTTGTVVTIPHGETNKFTPTRYDGEQPTTFLPGVQPGVFSLQISHPNINWTLGTTVVEIDATAPACPPSTEMPEEGNGTGVVIGLLGAGVVGAVMVRRMQRRLAPDPAGRVPAGRTSLEDDDA